MKEFKIISKTVKPIHHIFCNERIRNKWKDDHPLTVIEFEYAGSTYCLIHDDMTFIDSRSLWNVVIFTHSGELIEESTRKLICFYYVCDYLVGYVFERMSIAPEFKNLYDKISSIKELKDFLPEGTLAEIEARQGVIINR